MILTVASTTRQGFIARYSYIFLGNSYSQKLQREGVWHE